MLLVKVAAACLNQTPLDWEGNRKNIVAAIHEARAAKVGLLCLPELAISGYGCEDAFHSPSLWRTAIEVLEEIVPETEGIAVAIGLPLAVEGGLYNAVALVVDRRVRGVVAKQNLAGEGLHYEPRWFKPWPQGRRSVAVIAGESVPVGDLVFDVDGVRIAFEICEDAWVAERPGARLARHGVDIILNPSASHFAFGKFPVRKAFVAEGSRAFAVTYVYANLVGNESGRAIYDGGALIASGGELVAQGPRLRFGPSTLTSAVVDVDQTRRMRAARPRFRPDAGDNGGHVSVAWRLHGDLAIEQREAAPTWESSPAVREEEFARAVALALFDYLRKSRARGFVVSLSGGADSTAVCCLVALAVNIGCEELGVDGFTAHLSHIDLRGTTPRALVGELLTTVYQATANSGEVTRSAAAAVAESIGARHHEFDIEPLVAGYVQTVERALGRSLQWDTDDITLQNIQARARGPGAWMLANIQGSLLLSTSNRSEASVGYATMDGDTCGGLSPVAGINKAYLIEWLRWHQQSGPGELPGVAALAQVVQQRPTAELRPAEHEQTDEDDLMPYVVLDAIERAAVHDKRDPIEVLKTIEARFDDYTRPQLAAWVDRFFRLWCQNQWKRERYAPSFHVDDESVDPKTWCRFPILSGAYARELDALRQSLRDHPSQPSR